MLREIFACALSVCFMCPLEASAEELPKLPFSIPGPADNVSVSLGAFVKAGEKSPQVAAVLSRGQRALHIVFVPGILGSELKDENGAVLWGDWKPAVFHYQDFISKLMLPAAMIDEKFDGKVTAKLVKSMLGIEFYGEALESIRKRSRALGLDVTECGYDWRRDIRWGAAELNKCIENIPGDPKDLIIIAHSMGGIVTWTWAQERLAKKLVGRHRLLQATLLGAPLGGSCEILRMIETGYVMPDANDVIAWRDEVPTAGTPDWLLNVMNRIKGDAVNGVAARFTSDIRPIVLSWPGAVELTPPPTTTAAPDACAEVLSLPNNEQSPLTSYYDPAFWDLPIANDLLGTYKKPATLKEVLSKARDFRTQFSPSALDVPTWLYFSKRWRVPAQLLTVTKNNEVRIGADAKGTTWSYTQGDGRVSQYSSRAITADMPFGYMTGVSSVHGDLPADKTFLDDFFSVALPRFLNAHLLLAVTDEAIKDETILASYVGAGGRSISREFVLASYEKSRSDLGRPPLSESGHYAISAIDRFNRALSESGLTTAIPNLAYADWKMARGESPTIIDFRDYSALSAPTLTATTFAKGNLGLMQAKSGQWDKAVAPLAATAENFDTLPIGSTVAKKQEINAFKEIVSRNYGVALAKNGQCEAALPYLKEASDWPLAVQTLQQPCQDFSGLLYCFDKQNYCAGE